MHQWPSVAYCSPLATKSGLLEPAGGDAGRHGAAATKRKHFIILACINARNVFWYRHSLYQTAILFIVTKFVWNECSIFYMEPKSQLGPVDRASPSSPKIETSSIDWSQLSRLHLYTETESSLQNIVLNKNRTMDNVQKRNTYINVPSSQTCI
jgi:hypothetical protein